MEVQSLVSLRGLRIWHCCELWCRSQMWLESGVAVAVVQAGSCSSDLTSSLGISICYGCGPKKKKKLSREAEWTDKVHISQVFPRNSDSCFVRKLTWDFRLILPRALTRALVKKSQPPTYRCDSGNWQAGTRPALPQACCRWGLGQTWEGQACPEILFTPHGAKTLCCRYGKHCNHYSRLIESNTVGEKK